MIWPVLGEVSPATRAEYEVNSISRTHVLFDLGNIDLDGMFGIGQLGRDRRIVFTFGQQLSNWFQPGREVVK